MSDYIPPLGNAVVCDFAGTYTPPAGNAVSVDFASSGAPGAIFTQGFDSLELGHVSVAYTQWLYPEGFDSLEVSIPDARPGAFRSVNFTEEYEPPLYDDVSVDFGGTGTKFVGPYGFFSDEYGEHSVGLYVRSVFPFGSNHATYGVATIRNLQQAVFVHGWQSENHGYAAVRLARRRVEAFGFDSLTMEPAALDEDKMHVDSSIGPTRVIEPYPFDEKDDDGKLIGFGTHLVADAVRRITFPSGAATEMTRYGAHKVADRTKRITVTGWSSMTWSKPNLRWTWVVKPSAIAPSTQWGKPDVFLGNIRHIQGFDSSAFGSVYVRNNRRVIKVGDYKESPQFGTTYVYNKKQVVQAQSWMFSYFNNVGSGTSIKLHNRAIYTQGWLSERLPYSHAIYLNARVIAPLGINSAQPGKPDVSYKHRHVYPSWTVAGVFGPYPSIRNKSFQALPLGMAPPAISQKHRIWFNAQRIRPGSIFPHEKYGTAFVAWAVRTLQHYYPSDTFKSGVAWVSLGTRTIVQAPYVVPWAFGQHILYKHFNLLKPHPIAHSNAFYGNAQVKNVTPQIFATVGDLREVVSKPWVSHRIRTVQPTGPQTAAVGVPMMLFRNRHVYPPGLGPLRLHPGPRVWQEDTDVSHPRYLYPRAIDPTNPNMFGRAPTVHGSPYPEGWESHKMGANVIVSLQGCHPYWPQPDSLLGFGFPSLNATQHIAPGSIAPKEDDFPKQRIDPFTIYATDEMTEQAFRNHADTLPWHPVDTFVTKGVGHHRIYTATLQILRHYHLPSTLDFTIGETFGEDTFVGNHDRPIYPEGFLSQKFGYPSLNGPRKFRINSIPVSEVFGEHRVNSVPFSTQWALAIGVAAGAFGPKTFVQNQNRAVSTHGHDEVNFPFGRVHIVEYGPRGPKTAGGIDSLRMGTGTWISHYTRYVPMDGFESFEEGYTPGMFRERMRVSKTPVPQAPVSAGDMLRMGIPTVSIINRAPQSIRPYMIPPPVLCHPHMIELEEA